MSGLSEMVSSPAFCPTTRALAGTALVVEGGGQRGIYTAGVLDSWLFKSFNPFSILVGTSAGAQNLSSYMTCQKGFARRAIFGLTQHSRFFSLKRSLLKKSAVDLDWYFDQFEGGPYSLNIDQGLKRLEGRKLLFSATRVSNRKAEFFQPNQDNWFQLLKASSALPLLYRQGVRIGNQDYVDGGLAAPIPVREAYEQGARRIVVIRTLPKEQAIESPWAHRLKSWLCSENRCPAAIDLLTYHETAYRKAQDFMDAPPKNVEVVQLFPERSMRSKLVNSRFEDLDRDYNEGVKAGLRFLEVYGGQFIA